MSDKRWLDGYTGQTAEQLIALADAYRTDSIVLAFEAAIREKADRVGAQHLTTAERTVLAVEALEREVNSDGYIGLFTNVPGEVPVLEASLEAIGCSAVASITRRAIEALGIDGPLTPEAVVSAVEVDNGDRDDLLSECDQAYYGSAGDLARPLLGFIKANVQEISLP